MVLHSCIVLQTQETTTAKERGATSPTPHDCSPLPGQLNTRIGSGTVPVKRRHHNRGGDFYSRAGGGACTWGGRNQTTRTFFPLFCFHTLAQSVLTPASTGSHLQRMPFLFFTFEMCHWTHDPNGLCYRLFDVLTLEYLKLSGRYKRSLSLSSHGFWFCWYDVLYWEQSKACGVGWGWVSGQCWQISFLLVLCTGHLEACRNHWQQFQKEHSGLLQSSRVSPQ